MDEFTGEDVTDLDLVIGIYKTRCPSTERHVEIAAEILDLRAAGVHEDQILLRMLDYITTGIRYGNW